MSQDNDFELKLGQVFATQLPDDALDLDIESSRGPITAVFYPVPGKVGAVLWAGGGGELGLSLSQELRSFGISSLRLHYRRDGVFPECVLDALGGLSFLRGVGAEEVVVVGASFSGAVAICAGAMGEGVKAVAALCPQRSGTHLANKLSPRSLLLIHGTADTVILPAASEDIYHRAQEPKELVYIEGAEHGFAGHQEEIRGLLRPWIVKQVGDPTAVAAGASTPGQGPILTRGGPLVPQTKAVASGKEITVAEGNLARVEANAIVCPATDELTMERGVAAALVEAGGPEIQNQLFSHGTQRVGQVVITEAGKLSARFVFHAVIAATLIDYQLPTDEAVAMTTQRCLLLANALGLHSLAFPALGTGTGGLPMERVARIMLGLTASHLQGTTTLQNVTFALQGEASYRTFIAALRNLG